MSGLCRSTALLVDFASCMDARLIIRGLRAITDFEYELQMSQTNHKLEPKVETMFLTTSIQYSYLSSTTVREIAAFGGDLSQFVPEAVAVELKKKMNTKGECNHEQPLLNRLLMRSKSTIDRDCKYQPLFYD